VREHAGHNRDRLHGGWGGRTPDEVFFPRRVQLRPLGRVVYFDGAQKRRSWACEAMSQNLAKTVSLSA
jgi:hypothetical protein